MVIWAVGESAAHLWVRWSRLAEAPPPGRRVSTVALCCHDTHSESARAFRVVQAPFLTMSIMASETVFLSALQPNTSVTTYGLPSDIQLGNGGSVSNEVARARRVQQQVQMRLAEKSTLPRQNGSTSHYAMSGKRQQVSLLTLMGNYSGFVFCFVRGRCASAPGAG